MSEEKKEQVDLGGETVQLTCEDVKNLNSKEAKQYLCEYIKDNAVLQENYDKLQKEAFSYKDSWYRTSADFENFKKRNSEARSVAYKEGKIDTITKILVVGDNLERALSMQLDEKTKQGIELVLRQFKETLASLDVSEINPLGEIFDPNTSEAVMQVPKEEGEIENTVKQVFLKGYKLGDKIIRYAQVVVIG